MTRRRHLLVLLLLTVSTVAAGCSRVPPGGEVLGAGQGVTGTVGGFAAEPGTRATGEDVPLAGDSGVLSPDGAGAGGQQSIDGAGTSTSSGPDPGPSEVGGSTKAAAGARPGQGVKGKTVEVVFHAKLQDCGPDASTSSQGKASENGLKAIDDYVAFFNKDVLGPYGWKIAHKVIDDGGQYCPEKARAAALQITKELKPFATLGDSANGDQGPVLADITSRAGIVTIGVSWNTSAELRERHPYAWSIFGLAEQQDRYLVEFMAKRVKGTKAPDLTIGAPTDRVYGMLTVDNPESRTLAEAMKRNLAAQGIALKHTYYVSSDPGVAAQTANNTVLKMKQDGVNSLIFAIPYTSLQSAIVHTSAMGSQGYLPDLLSSRYGVVFFDRLFDTRVWEKMRGVFQCAIGCIRATGTNPGYIDVNENGSAYKAAWTHIGNSGDPDNGTTPGAYNTWTVLSHLAIGILNAGPVLNAQTFAAGMDRAAPGGPAECIGWRLMGRPYEHAPYTAGWSSRHDTGIIGYTPGYWVNRKNDFGTVGYYESYDNYRYFASGKLPVKATHDTGQAGAAVPKQKPIGLRPWISCKKFGMQD